MPRTTRASVGDICYHVINRGNAQARVFHEDGDYLAFTGLIVRACERLPMRVAGYCVLPNHFHLVLWPRLDGDLSRWMQWLMTAHVRRYHRCNRSSGHVWQGRFKAFPIQKDDHLLTVLRYVERNPLRAGLVAKASDWPWSILAGSPQSSNEAPERRCPVALPTDWVARVDGGEESAELNVPRERQPRHPVWRGALGPTDRCPSRHRGVSQAPRPAAGIYEK